MIRGSKSRYAGVRCMASGSANTMITKQVYGAAANSYLHEPR